MESGAFAFGVGEEPAPGSAVVVELLHTSPWASALAAAGRWLLYAGLVLLIGAATTSLIVYGGRLPAGGVTVLRSAVAGRRRRRLGRHGVVGEGAHRGAEPAAAVRDAAGPAAAGAGRRPRLLHRRRRPRRPVAGALEPVAARARPAPRPSSSTSLAGHAASPSSLEALNVLVQWVHMTAIGVWVGGLFWLLLGFRGRDAAERAGRRRRLHARRHGRAGRRPGRRASRGRWSRSAR